MKKQFPWSLVGSLSLIVLWAGFIFKVAGPTYPFSTGAALVALALAVMVVTRARSNDRP